jgi:hypothetical protein
MNSVLVSDRDDSAENREEKILANLLLGTQQCRIPRIAGTVRVALVHHPPNWLKDWGQVRPYVDRAHVVLFGHEHSFASEQSQPGGSVYVHAGAVGPEHGPEWVPSYNVLTLATVDEQVQVDVEPRSWKPDKTCFGLHEDGKHSFSVVLEPPDSDLQARVEDAIATEDETGPANATPLSPPVRQDTQVAEGVDPAQRRELVFRYLSTPKTEREAIARRLGVFEEGETGLPEGELYASILRRIRDRGLIDDLMKELKHG